VSERIKQGLAACAARCQEIVLQISTLLWIGVISPMMTRVKLLVALLCRTGTRPCTLTSTLSSLPDYLGCGLSTHALSRVLWPNRLSPQSSFSSADSLVRAALHRAYANASPHQSSDFAIAACVRLAANNAAQQLCES
jgi:hypothetical protein